MAEPKDELDAAARMVVNCRFVDPAHPTTNGDQIRKIGSMTDPELAELLWQVLYDDLEDKIRFCPDRPECEELAEQGAVPEENCKQCLIDWLGKQAAPQREIATSAAPPRNDNGEG